MFATAISAERTCVRLASWHHPERMFAQVMALRRVVVTTGLTIVCRARPTSERLFVEHLLAAVDEYFPTGFPHLPAKSPKSRHMCEASPVLHGATQSPV